jgi:hypothetical protein
LDVLVSHRADEHRVAVVYLDREQAWASARYGFEDPEPVGVSLEPGLQQPVDLGSDPAILAGALPAGAAGMRLRVGRRPWVEPTAVNRGWWLCVLDQRVVDFVPDIAYFDAEGQEFEITVPFDGPELPRLQAPGAEVEVSRYGLVGAGAVELLGGGDSWPIPGSVLGRRHGFELAVHGRHWLALGQCGTFAVIVRATGEPPARLDLEAALPK